MDKKNNLIILIEPDEAVRAAIASLLKQDGWEINARANASELKDVLSELAPFALICESALQDITARQVLRACKANDVPVIFLGHKREIQEAVDLIHMGASDFLEKPFPQDRLLRLLNSLSEESPS
jgi:DNA-binding NtrC family response regulator